MNTPVCLISGGNDGVGREVAGVKRRGTCGPVHLEHFGELSFDVAEV